MTLEKLTPKELGMFVEELTSYVKLSWPYFRQYTIEEILDEVLETPNEWSMDDYDHSTQPWMFEWDVEYGDWVLKERDRALLIADMTLSSQDPGLQDLTMRLRR
jgi:hypothetical protein